MPNHVAHRIVCTGTVAEVAAFKELMVVKEPTSLHEYKDGQVIPVTVDVDKFDFNRIIPRPPVLERVINPLRFGPNGRVMLYVDSYKSGWVISEGGVEATVEEMEQLKLAIPYTDWYTWSIENWGTKWNSYGFAEVDDQARYEFTFDTAWSPPGPVFDTLKDRFPGLTFDVGWFDEGWMHAGRGVLGPQSTLFSMDEMTTEANDEIYEHVYGIPHELFDDLDPEFYPFETAVYLNQSLDNFTCNDVLAASDADGYYTVTSVIYPGDVCASPDLSDDERYQLMQTRDAILSKILA